MIDEFIGKIFSDWTILAFSKKDKYYNKFYLCRCRCGRESIVCLSRLKNETSQRCKSCSNRQNNIGNKNAISHGKSKFPEFRIWSAMIQRCSNPNKTNFKYYGGRGICVCSSWKNSFEKFYADMGPRPTPNHTIDRINNDGNYEPQNCKWATKSEQSKNKRPYGKSNIKGVYFSKKNNKWQASVKVGGKNKHLGSFDNKDDAASAVEKFIKTLCLENLI